MIKQMIQWEGFDGKPASRTLYFNLTRYEIAHDMELEVLEQRFKRFQEEVIDPAKRSMTPPEIRELLDIFKTIIKHAYGIRSQDGKRFTKNDEVWNEFVETGAFDAFLWYMFEDASRANSFMTNIWPKEIQEAAAKVREERPDIHPVADFGTVSQTPETQQDAPDDNIPSLTSVVQKVEDEKPWYEYTKEEMDSLSDEEFDSLVERSKRGNNVPAQLLVIGGQRKNRGAGAE